ncbi:MAG: GAF domain-containing protein [Candidatus Latescibacteria bacterium]|nr:GAF domain-containing protein [Candidatus Latescibacterota bacterium]
MALSRLKQIFGKKRYDFKEAFSEFSKSLTLIIDIDQLKDNVISKIREVIQVDTILIFLLNPDLNRYELAESRGLESPETNQFFFFPDEPLIKWFTINETFLSISKEPEIFSYFSDHEQQILNEAGIQLLFPLLVMNRVAGLVCLGQKETKKPFTKEEIELLNTLLGQAAFAFENAYLYRQQKTRLKKMYRADRLATLGQLSAGAAHEIRNPLTSIRSTIQYLQKEVQDENKRTLVSGLLEEVDRINDIIEGLLSFSKPSTPQTEQVNLKALLEQTISLVGTTAKKQNINITFDFKTPENMLKADPSQLKQVFLNIIMNAVQAMEYGGDFNISADLMKIEGFASQPRNSFYIVFKDSGKGIPGEHLDHIFDPFFTTKKDGTGLGLSISYGIIQQHGGDIEIESHEKTERPGDYGTTVSILLPVM